MPPALILIYLVLCAYCGLMGRKTAIGFIGHFLLAVIITPLGDILVQLFGRPSRDIRRRLEDMPGE